MKKTKAILSAVCLLFCSFAAADAETVLHQNVDVVTAKAVSGHAAFSRVRIRKTLVSQAREAGSDVLAIAPVRSAEFQLLASGFAPSFVSSIYAFSCERSASARAPPSA